MAEEAGELMEQELISEKTACERICRRYDVKPFNQMVEKVRNELPRLKKSLAANDETRRIKELLAVADCQREKVQSPWWDRD
ncbi:MAG: hypothetical protein AAB585_00420 [Patescibacteria group bacterium]